MSENKKNINGPYQLSDDELASVNGGGFRLSNDWDITMENDIQRDYAANGNGMSMDDYLRSRGVGDTQIACRNFWLKQGSPDFMWYSAMPDPLSSGGYQFRGFPF